METRKQSKCFLSLNHLAAHANITIRFLAKILADDCKLYGDSPDLSALGTPGIVPVRQNSPALADDDELEEDE
jgi:hypothetical protein